VGTWYQHKNPISRLMLGPRPDLSAGEEIEFFFAALAGFTSEWRQDFERRNCCSFTYSAFPECR
jgi:hypothetical protein